MLYQILKPLMKAALRLYFRRIVRYDLKHIDCGKATIILANHTASFMDAVITACFVKRRIHFFTRGDIFSNVGAERVMRSLGMLPIYRIIDGKDMLRHNESSNAEALQILAEGGAVLIFCEGISDIAPFLKPLKKGPFRLAATANSEIQNPPALVPLGLNYVNPIKPFGDAFLVANHQLAELDNVIDPAQSATLSMRAANTALMPLVWHVQDNNLHPLASICLAALQEIKPEFSFEESQTLINRLKAGKPETEKLLKRLESVKYSSKERLLSAFSKLSALDCFILLIGFPIAALGVLGNFPPIAIAQIIVQKKVAMPDFKAAVFISIATLLSVFWLLLLLVFGLVNLEPLIAITAIASIIFSGWFFLKIYRIPLMHFQDWLLRKRVQKAAISEFQALLKSFVMHSLLEEN
ncbi:MAG: 1-acyl-sn-glycerol-3-phosphate acyltransferase [Chitinophagaceae bacterium]